MIEDLSQYKVSITQIMEAEHCPFSLFMYMTTETRGVELARGADFAAVEAEFWKEVDVGEMLKRPFDVMKKEKYDQQEVFKYFYELIPMDDDHVVDTVVPLLYFHFCIYQTRRFGLMRKEYDYLMDYFLPEESEFEIEGTCLTGRPDAVFRIPPTSDHFYIEDTKTSLYKPTWKAIDNIVPPDKRTNQYRRVANQLTVYKIIKEEHGQNVDYGHVLHICPTGFFTAIVDFLTVTKNTIVKKKVPYVRNLLSVFRDIVTEADNLVQLRKLADLVIPKKNPWKCQRCSRSEYCIAASF